MIGLFASFSQSDWTAFAAVISAFVAIGALLFNVYWSSREARRTIGQRLAEIEIQWIELFREQVAVVSNSGNLLNGARSEPENERIQSLRSETLFAMGKLDLMFAGFEHPEVNSFMGALFEFRAAIKANAEGGAVQLGPLNTELRKQANNVMAVKLARVRELMDGRI